MIAREGQKNISDRQHKYIIDMRRTVIVFVKKKLSFFNQSQKKVNLKNEI